MVYDDSKPNFIDMAEAPKAPDATQSMFDFIQEVKETVWTKPVVIGSLTVLAITGICLAVYFYQKDDDDNAGGFKWPWNNNQD